MTSSPFERLDTPRRLRDTTPVPEGILIGRAHVPAVLWNTISTFTSSTTAFVGKSLAANVTAPTSTPNCSVPSTSTARSKLFATAGTAGVSSPQNEPLR